MNQGKPPNLDTVYATARDMIVDFEFDDAVAKVFSDMLRRSVPGYKTLITMIGLLAEQYVTAGSICYDLGCSLGASTMVIGNRLRGRDCRIIAVDNSVAMLHRCRENLQQQDSEVPVQLVCADIQDIRIQNASVVVLNLTLQFVPKDKRLQILKSVYEGLIPGGIVIISEKALFESADEQNFQDGMHIAFKKANAYSALEISQKRQALEHVLIPETTIAHQQRLLQAGFDSVYVWYQCFNFISLVAQKAAAKK